MEAFMTRPFLTCVVLASLYATGSDTNGQLQDIGPKEPEQTAIAAAQQPASPALRFYSLTSPAKVFAATNARTFPFCTDRL